MAKKKILVTGSNGQLGCSLQTIANNYSDSYEFIFTDVAELDITDRKSVAEFLAIHNPKCIINAAAYTNVDGAESDVEKARLINASAVENLAQESLKIGAALVHISTDYVFEGNLTQMLTENAETNPQSVYGITKLEGETEAMKNPRSIVIRTSWLYSVYGNNFVKTMMKLGVNNTEVNVVGDQWGSPTSADDLAKAIMVAIDATTQNADLFGLYHFSNTGATCWADFAQQIMDLSNLNCTVNFIDTDQYPTVAKRPGFTVMNTDKFRKAFNFDIPEWEISLEKTIESLLKSHL